MLFIKLITKTVPLLLIFTFMLLHIKIDSLNIIKRRVNENSATLIIRWHVLNDAKQISTIAKYLQLFYFL